VVLVTAATVHVEQPIVWTGLIGGLVGMFGVGLLAIAVIFEEPRRTPPGLPPAATWTWSESWASNLTALITALSAIAAVFSNSLDPLVDQSVLVTFGLTTAALLVLAACAPLAYAVFQEVGQRLDVETADPGDPIPLNGTWYGWVIASALTVAAVEGSLAAAQASIVLASDGALGVVVILVIILVQALVFAYAGRTFWLVMHTPHTDSLQSLLPGITTERVRAGHQPPEIRMTLL
jgi:hypothetical protein